eukprot:13830583-Alexandrium_andersonii.AAC.1
MVLRIAGRYDQHELVGEGERLPGQRLWPRPGGRRLRNGRHSRQGHADIREDGPAGRVAQLAQLVLDVQP